MRRLRPRPVRAEDLLIKLKAENVDTIGKFIIDRLRLVKGIEKTLTCMVFETCKETTEIPINTWRKTDMSHEQITKKRALETRSEHQLTI